MRKMYKKAIALAVMICCTALSLNVPVKAAAVDPAEEMWAVIREEFDLKKEETSLVYDETFVSRSAQKKAVAVKSETVDGNGNVEVTYYVPYTLSADEELINSFEIAERSVSARSATGNFSTWNVIFTYTANYSNVSQPVSVGYMTFFLPTAFSLSYRLNGSGEVASITNLTGRYDIVCNLYATPYCLNTELPTATYTNYNVYAQFTKASPTVGTSYNATTNMPSGYLAKCEGVLQSGGIIATFTYRTSNGTVKTGMGSVKIH